MKSLFIRSEALFWKYHSNIERVDGAWVVTTPENPTWNWGNFLVLEQAPKAGDAERWLELFREKVNRNFKGTIMTWDEGEIASDALAAFDALGLSMSTADILTLRDIIKPAHYNPNVELTELGVDDPLWQDATNVNIDGFGPMFGPNYELYAQRRFMHLQDLVRRGLGNWYVAKLGGEVAGGLGIFEGDGFCRFQEIVVREKFRRQGVASTMTYEVALRAQERWPGIPLVIVAESGGDANRVYRSLGFAPHSISQALQAKT